MKKTILYLSLLLVLFTPLSAQDTLWMKPAPLANYFSNNWIDTTERYVASLGQVLFAHVSATQFITQDTLQVYGIAAIVVSVDYAGWDSTYISLQTYLNNTYPDDPSFDNCEELLLLYQYNGNDSTIMQPLGEGLPVHKLHTPVSHWVMSNTPIVSYMDTIAKPLYERYFPIPQMVHDTFYVGISQRDEALSKIDSVWHPVRPPLGLLGIGYPDQRCLNGVVAALRQDSIQNPSRWEFRSDYTRHYDFIFPILTPPDTTAPPTDTVINPIDTTVNPIDTTVNPIDTVVNPIDTTVVGIRGMDMLYRYTAVQPNPATDKVKVVSSFGLTRIEVYDEQGRKVSELRIPDSGPQATLDVSSWPRGTYLLRITTPVGPTTKKLLVQ